MCCVAGELDWLRSKILYHLEDPTLAINDPYNIDLASTTMTLEWDPPGGFHSRVIVVLTI